MSGADIGEREIASVVSVLRSGCLSIGPQLEQFERGVAQLAGTRHAIGVSSGTAGLHLAVIAAGVRPGDFVITTPFSFVASSNSVLYEGGIPVFVDVDPATGNIDPDRACEAIRDLHAGGAAACRWLPRALRQRRARAGMIKGVLPVHAFGQPADMDPLVGAARAHGLAVIEDACEAIGSMRCDRPAGAIGDAGVFAFYPNKQMTTGEGGMIVTNRDDWAALFRSLRNQGRDTMDAWLRHDRLGYNYRMSELAAALGVAQLSRLPELLTARERVAEWYRTRLCHVPAIETPRIVPATTRMSWFAYVIRLAPSVDRARVMHQLARRGVPSRTYFAPIHLQPFYGQRFGYREGDFPVAEALGRRSLALPFSGMLTCAQVERVCDAIEEAVST